MQRKLSLGGIFLLFLLFFAIISSIHPATISTEDTIPGTEDIISFTEDTISTKDLSSTEPKSVVADFRNLNFFFSFFWFLFKEEPNLTLQL
jgi:hypothetical protein